MADRAPDAINLPAGCLPLACDCAQRVVQVHPCLGRSAIDPAARLQQPSHTAQKTGAVGLAEKPKPGNDGITRWNASSALPPWAVGSVDRKSVV